MTKPSIEVRMVGTSWDELKRRVPQRAGRALTALANEGVTHVKVTLFNSSPPGRTYRRGKGRMHTASIPGLPPNVDMGTLTGSMRVEPAGGMRVRIVAATEYAEFLEYGTPKMAARPFMRPMVVHLKAVSEDFFRNFLTG